MRRRSEAVAKVLYSEIGRHLKFSFHKYNKYFSSAASFCVKEINLCPTPLIHFNRLVVSLRSATLVNSCRITFIGFQSASVSFIWFLQLLGVVSFALLLLIFRSFLSYHRPARVDDHFARPLVVTI